MIAMQYRIVLPSDYDMEIIRKRVPIIYGRPSERIQNIAKWVF